MPRLLLALSFGAALSCHSVSVAFPTDYKGPPVQLSATSAGGLAERVEYRNIFLSSNSSSSSQVGGATLTTSSSSTVRESNQDAPETLAVRLAEKLPGKSVEIEAIKFGSHTGIFSGWYLHSWIDFVGGPAAERGDR